MDNKALAKLDKLEKSISKIASSMLTKNDAKNFATKEDLKRFATKDDLNAFATKKDLERFASKDDLLALEKRFATKDDLETMSDKIIEDIGGLITNFADRLNEKKVDKTEVEVLKLRVKEIERKTAD